MKDLLTKDLHLESDDSLLIIELINNLLGIRESVEEFRSTTKNRQINRITTRVLDFCTDLEIELEDLHDMVIELEEDNDVDDNKAN